MNSRDKGKRGEREWAEVMRANGWNARRGQQFSGGNESPDVVSNMPIHWEVKRVENLNLQSAVAQARRDSQGGRWAVAHRRNGQPWLVTIDAELFFDLAQTWKPEK